MAEGGEPVAFEARALAKLLVRNRALMDAFKRAAGEGLIQALPSKGRNFTVVGCAQVQDAIARVGAKIACYKVDPDSGEVQV